MDQFNNAKRFFFASYLIFFFLMAVLSVDDLRKSWDASTNSGKLLSCNADSATWC